MEKRRLIVMRTLPKRISVSLDPETYARVYAMIPHGEKQASFVVRHILREYFSRQGAAGGPAVAEPQADYGSRAAAMLEQERVADELRRSRKRQPVKHTPGKAAGA